MHKVLKYFLSSMVVAGALVSCSIYDDHEGISQANVTAQLVSNDSVVLPDSLVHGYKLYFFKDGLYADMQPEYKNGRYVIVFPSSSEVSFVALAEADSANFTINQPTVGESIDNTWLTAKSASDDVPPYPQGVYYGRLDIGSTEGDRVQDYAVSMKPYDSQLRVYIKNALDLYGKGDYQCVVQGLRNSITYGGKTTGDYVIYNLTGDMNSSGDWQSTPLHVFPSNEGDVIRVMLYKDRSLVFESTVDENGQPLSVARGSDLCFYFTVTQIGDITLKVINWAEVPGEIVIN